MHEITLEPKSINIEALDGSLRNALGAVFIGISTGPYGVRIHLVDAATSQQIAQARAVAQTHNPMQLTPQQQSEQQRHQRLEASRSANSADLDVLAYQNADVLLRQLAQKIAWLEQEIADLRAN
jgi:hypothetical protein